MPERTWIRWPEGRGTPFGYGADYNPEQWPRETWLEDVRLMREAGVTIVSLGIFAWSLLEPRDGAFDFSLLDDVMDLLHEHGVAVDLATATASPPAWLVTAHPDMRPVDAEGRVLGFGGRQSICPSSPVYRHHSLRLVRALAEHVRDHPALALWHVNNEFGCHNAHCYCDTSAAAFRAWLRARHGTIAALNDAWATSFWSQRYGTWDEIVPPRLAPTFCNPGQQLDFFRFSSDAHVEQYLAEAAVLHEVTPDVPVTTNFMNTGGTKWLDYLGWGAHVDVVSNDHYLQEPSPHPEAELAFSADLTRGCARGKPWMLMEQSTSAVNWGRINRAKDPGELWRNSLSQVGRGADAICYFQWRASAGGAEKFHSAMVPHAGSDTRVFREVTEQGRRLAALAEVQGSVVANDVALLFDFEAWWASELDSHPHNGFSYRREAERLYVPLWRRGVGVDVVHPDADLSGYRLVLVPALYLVADGLAPRLEAFAAAGGTVLVTFFSGIVDVTDRVRLGGYPGAFRDLLGVRVEEFRPLRPGCAATLSDGSRALDWSEDLSAPDAAARLTYADGVLAGRPAVTRRQAGAGSAWYVSCDLQPDAAASVLDAVLADAGVTALAEADDALELTRRVHADGRAYLFAINHSGADAALHAGGTDLLTGAIHEARVVVPAGGTVVLRIGG